LLDVEDIPPSEPVTAGGPTSVGTSSPGPGIDRRAISCRGGEVAERLKAALLKSAESKDFVGSNPTLSASVFR
jgi:hypothetical protein